MFINNSIIVSFLPHDCSCGAVNLHNMALVYLPCALKRKWDTSLSFEIVEKFDLRYRGSKW